MALPGKDNPFLKGLTEKAPIVGAGKPKIFEKISLATGTKVTPATEDKVSSEKTETEVLTLPEAINEQTHFTAGLPLPTPSFNTTGKQEANNKRTKEEQPVNNSRTTSKQQVNIPNSKDLISKELPFDTNFDPLFDPSSKNNARTSSEQPVNNTRITREHAGTTGKQRENIELTTQKQPVNEPVNHRVNEPVNKQENNSIAVSPKSKSVEDFIIHRIKGHKRKILAIVYRKTRPDDFISDPIDTEVFMTELQTDQDSIKTVIRRLEKSDGYLKIVDSYSSPSGGWRIFSMPEYVYRALDRADAAGFLNESQTASRSQPVNNRVNNRVNKQENKPVNSASSSSSFSFNTDNKTTTTGEQVTNSVPVSSELPAEWQEIDFSDLLELGLHFGRPQLKQWFERRYCDATQAQESIWHFAYYLKHSKKGEIKTGPLNFFMGVMAKSKYFPRPDGYLSPEDEALKKRVESERKAAELRRDLQDELFDLAFEKWFDSRTGDEINALTPTLNGLEAKKATLRNKFRDEFYLIIRDDPTIDVRTLKLEASTQKQIAERSKSPTSGAIVRDPLDTLRKMVAHLTEEIRQIEEAIRVETRESLKAELQKSLSGIQKKKQHILDINPTLAQEVTELEQAINALPHSPNAETTIS